MKALKKVPPGAKGLRKLPTAVRNKMGYMQQGGKFAPMTGKKVTKKMVDDNFKRDEDRSANFTNELAKMAATGKKENGFPMKPAAREALKKDVARRKKREQNAKPNYRYVGTRLPAGPAPFEDDGMPKAKNGMKAVKKYQKGGKVKKSYKKTSLSTKDQEGSFSARTKRTKGAYSAYAPYDSEYSQKYQNKMVGPTSRASGGAKRIGYQEERMRSRDKFDKVMGLRAEAYKARENNFGIKKPKAKVMKSGGKVVKYQKGGKQAAAMDDRKKRLEEIKANSIRMKQEKAVLDKIARYQKRQEALGKAEGQTVGFGLSQQERQIYNEIRKNGRTRDIKKG